MTKRVREPEALWEGGSHLEMLPQDLIALILSHVTSVKEVFALRRVSRRFKKCVAHLLNHPPLRFVRGLEADLLDVYDQWLSVGAPGPKYFAPPYELTWLGKVDQQVYSLSPHPAGTCHCGRQLCMVTNTTQHGTLCFNARCLLKRALMLGYAVSSEDAVSKHIPDLKGW